MTNILALLMAVSVVESNNDDHAVGKAGEISRFQIKPHVFKVHALPLHITLSDATDPRKAYLVARSIALSHDALLLRESVPRTAENHYICWNIGFYAFKQLSFDKRRVNPTTLRKAAKVQSLYDKHLLSLRPAKSKVLGADYYIGPQGVPQFDPY